MNGLLRPLPAAALVGLLLFLGGPACTSEIELDVVTLPSIAEGWLFAPGDDARWAAAAPEASRPIEVNRAWERAGYPDRDGYGWYFRRVTLPPGITGDLGLFLGRIDDADEVFVNGTRIGASGAMPPDFKSEWSANRWYLIPRDLVRSELLIAVRVFDNGGGGGMVEGLPRLMTRAAYDQAQARRFGPERSFFEIPFANGLASAKFHVTRRYFDSFREHIYSQYDAATRTRDFGKEIWFGAGVTPPAIRDAAFENGSGIVHYVAELNGRAVDCHAFAPMTSDRRQFVYLVRTGRDFTGPARFTLRFDLGSGSTVHGDGARWVQRSADGRDVLTFNLLSDDGSARGRFEDETLHLEGWSAENEWLGLVVTLTTSGPDLSPEPRTPATMLAEERAWWTAWQASARQPRFKSEAERALFRQSQAILKMAQCREPGPAYGQILASLPPGHWNICWIRDAGYALDGLVHAGRFAEVEAALRFFLEAEVGDYRSFVQDGREWGVGVPYQISVCRYYGGGREESDGGADPNIELDGFGLFLWALDRYVTESGDDRLLVKHREAIFERIADVLIHSIEAKTGIIREESGPWERHLRDDGYNGARRFSYTSATAYQGFISAARLAERLDEIALARRYRRAAADLKAAFAREFVGDGGFIRGLQEETDITRCLDAGAVEGINFGVVDDTTARRTLAVFDQYLRKAHTVGYMRNDDGGDYDRHEWVVIDLRIARAFAALGERERFEALVDWVTAQSAENFNLIAELYSHGEADYTGAIPMCGFGPGAYIAALFARDVER